MDTEITEKQRKKLLFVVTLAELGGAQKYVRDLTEGLRKDFEITIAANTADETLLSWAQEKRVKIFPLRHLERRLTLGVLPTVGDFKTFREIARHIRAERYDIVHLNSSKMGLIGALAARLAGTAKIVFTAHGWIFNEPKTIRGKRWLWVLISRIAAGFQDQIICVSEYDFDQALRYHIAPPRKLVTVRNGLDINKIAYLRRAQPRKKLEEKINGNNETIIAGTIANHYPTKDLGTMIEAIGQVKNSNLKLVVFGDGPEKQNLELEIKNQGVEDKVFLLGRVQNAAQYLKAFDLYLISSLKEGLPFSALEAMAAGLPIVSTPVGGLRELLFPESGIRNQESREKQYALEFTPGNRQELARQIKKLITDEDFATGLSQNAKERVAALFLLKNMLQKTRWVWELS